MHSTLPQNAWSWCHLTLGDDSLKSEFKPGDVVQLKSGGGKMTVSKVEIDAYADPEVMRSNGLQGKALPIRPDCQQYVSRK
jgi:hypothetical protein